jgi:hypothetical protein
LLELNVTKIYPRHGKPFSIKIIKEELEQTSSDIKFEKSEGGDIVV